MHVLAGSVRDVRLDGTGGNPTTRTFQTIVFSPAVLSGPAPDNGTWCVAGYVCNLTMAVGGLPPFVIGDTYIQVVQSTTAAG